MRGSPRRRRRSAPSYVCHRATAGHSGDWGRSRPAHPHLKKRIQLIYNQLHSHIMRTFDLDVIDSIYRKFLSQWATTKQWLDITSKWNESVVLKIRVSKFLVAFLAGILQIMVAWNESDKHLQSSLCILVKFALLLVWVPGVELLCGLPQYGATAMMTTRKECACHLNCIDFKQQNRDFIIVKTHRENPSTWFNRARNSWPMGRWARG